MLRRIHPIAGLLGFLVILAFWTATVASELSGSMAMVAAVKQAIPWGFILLVPALAVAGASGFRLAGGSVDPVVVRKRRRMPFIAANGLLVLVPAALILATLASHGAFGRLFYAIQAVELVAGAVNLALMSLNIRDGLRLTRRFQRAV
jgi:uncharacterized membrane protein SpoIIM required for sporulation